MSFCIHLGLAFEVGGRQRSGVIGIIIDKLDLPCMSSRNNNQADESLIGYDG